MEDIIDNYFRRVSTLSVKVPYFSAILSYEPYSFTEVCRIGCLNRLINIIPCFGFLTLEKHEVGFREYDERVSLREFLSKCTPAEYRLVKEQFDIATQAAIYFFHIDFCYHNILDVAFVYSRNLILDLRYLPIYSFIFEGMYFTVDMHLWKQTERLLSNSKKIFHSEDIDISSFYDYLIPFDSYIMYQITKSGHSFDLYIINIISEKIKNSCPILCLRDEILFHLWCGKRDAAYLALKNFLLEEKQADINCNVQKLYWFLEFSNSLLEFVYLFFVDKAEDFSEFVSEFLKDQIINITLDGYTFRKRY